ncbi:alpha/beta hydrolase [Micrococcus sp. ACRRV]|uniref:alpha/beta fold hydrolase n=1 Tax=Micrococcus sp. ACRRV TaxID=2918203 RepID=UPI001EF318BF|nr:alpha/beta hydrolase [Micrococcus sp. ACRRV]
MTRTGTGDAAFVPGDPRGFAPVGPAAHREGERTVLFDGTVAVDHWFTVPVDHALTLAEALAQDAAGTGLGPGGRGTLEVFAREVRHPEDPEGERPWLLYLQGGPGSGGPRPARLGGWQCELAQHHRLLLLDQRGTARSTPVTAATLAGLPDDAARAAYLTHLRAPQIVQDAEMIRVALGAPPWTTLGQSFGGFCTLSYLSWRAEGLERCLVTGGLAPLTGHADRVYRATTARMHARWQEFLERHPQDAGHWAEAVALIRAAQDDGDPYVLPDGTALTVGRAQQLGMLLGGNTRVDGLHWVLAEAVDRSGGEPRLSPGFLAAVAAQTTRAVNPLYAVLHEAIYAQPAALTDGRGATAWSAQRVLAEHPDSSPAADPAPVPTGEHVLPWAFETEPELRALAGVAALLAAKDDWGALYDLDALAANEVPVAAAVYTDDVYVDRDLSLETAARVRGLQVWETDAFHHDGLADDGPGIVRRLRGMLGA